MNKAESIKNVIRRAFVYATYPGDNNLRGSNQGEEPYLLEEEFKGKTDWRTLDVSFIDLAPDGFGSALSFFSTDAFRFYLPAFLIADIDEVLMHGDPVFYLCYGLDDSSKNKIVNPRFYGNQTWFELKRQQFEVFNKHELQAIVAYLRYMLDAGRLVDSESKNVNEALKNYWLLQAGESL
ncbi:MAG: DUF6714 family protein [Planctomycetota bacterium]|jgi:hypothetical protein